MAGLARYFVYDTQVLELLNSLGNCRCRDTETVASQVLNSSTSLLCVGAASESHIKLNQSPPGKADQGRDLTVFYELFVVLRSLQVISDLQKCRTKIVAQDVCGFKTTQLQGFFS
jgi:hypothetical protein